MSNKVSILHFGAVPAPEIVYLQIGDTTLEVTKRIPYETVIDLIEWAINSVLDDRTFISEPLYQIIRDIAIMKFYTNLDTDNLGQGDFVLTDFYEWYDILQAFEVPEKVARLIDQKQFTFLTTALEKTIHSLMAYRNSAAGIIDRLTTQNNKDNAEMQTIISKLAQDDPELSNVRKLMDMFGQDPLLLSTQLSKEINN